MNIPRIDGIDPERLLAIIENIQKQREPAIEKSNNSVETFNINEPKQSGFIAAPPSTDAPLPALGRHVNIWA